MVAAVAMAAGVALASPVPAAVGPLVQMVDNEPDLTNWHFDPAQLTVPAGSTVVWHNRGKEEHSVTADDKSFDSGYKKPGTDFQRVFPRIGKFSYHCAPHPWMTGVIQVVAAPTTTTTVPAATTTAAAAAPGSATTTLPPSLGAQTPGQPGRPGGSGGSGGSATPAAPGATTTAPASGASGSSSAAPAGKRSHSGAGLAGAIAVVLIPTLAALAVGARVRRSRERPLA
jgi:plastocyanin